MPNAPYRISSVNAARDSRLPAPGQYPTSPKAPLASRAAHGAEDGHEPGGSSVGESSGGAGALATISNTVNAKSD